MAKKKDYILRSKAIKAVTGWDTEPTDEELELALMDIPVADVAPVRRGRWIRTGEDGYCSVCKCDMPMFRNDWEWEYTETPYCPNCGARIEAIE